MTLTVHRAERADLLVGRLAEMLSAVPADPFTPDLVSVPSRGVERWIAQSLSTSLGVAAGSADGVCANVLFPSPRRLVREALATVSGVDADDDPWAERRLVWPLLEVVDSCASEPWCRTLGRHLGVVGDGVNHGRRMAVAQKLARLYTSYSAERPSMLLQWRAGSDTDGYSSQLDDDQTWQAELWRRLRAHIGSDSPAERLGPACDRLREQPDLVDLPDRISFFGPTRLASDELTVIDALATHRDLHLWLPHPSDGLWRRVSAAVGDDAEIRTRRDDPVAEVPEHPLVRSLGRDAREMQARLHAHASIDGDEHLEPPKPDGTLLAVLQRDLRDDATPTAQHVVANDDSSIQVHSCHGRHRQVEVLREVLLGLLDDDPSLELRDIIVMCPDIEAYAPLVSAAFGGLDAEALDRLDLDRLDLDRPKGDRDQQSIHPGHRLTFRLADRSLRQTNPVLAVAARLLDLADSRLTASEVLDLVAMPPVRRRFGLDDDDLERVGDWVRRAGVRWGLDPEARAPYGLVDVAQNTWRHGLDRILVGVAMDEDDLRAVGTALPLDDVDSTEVDLAGKLAELLDRLAAAVDGLTTEQSLEDWIATLDVAVDAFVDVAPADAWQVTQAKGTLAGAVASATEGAAGTALRLSDVRALLGDRLAGRPTRANFRTGHLTVCTMVPMRSVPHRVVCLLGLDDGVFPRSTHVDGDDILARRPRVGERDRRSEDRQLFLDAILAAKERLVVLYTGADERTGATRPPAVPLGELLDVLDRSATAPEGRVRDHVLVRHPLQPFDGRNFEPGALLRRGTFSFDRASYDGSRILREGRAGRPPFLTGSLPEPKTTDPIPLDNLIRFLEHPVRGFLRERLELRTADEQEEPSDGLPVVPSKLEEWAVGDRLLRAGLRGQTPADATHVERLRGELPPGRLGDSALAPLVENVHALLGRSGGLLAGTPDTLDVSVTLPSGATVAGSVPRVYGDKVVRIEYSKLSAKHRIRAWVQLLALTAQWPDREWSTATVGRGSRDPVVGSFLGGVTAEEAAAHLETLVRVYRLGLTRPLAVPPKTACVYAEKRLAGVGPTAAAALAGKEWRVQGQRPWGEFDDGDHRRVGLVDMDDVLADPPPHGSGEYADEPYLFGMLARQVWTPLLEHELVTG